MGISLGAGLTNIEINGSSVFSSLFSGIGSWFESTSSGSSSSSSSLSWDPISHITTGWDKVSQVAVQASESFSVGYQWIKQWDNFQIVIDFFKNFWGNVFIKDLVFNLHTTIRSWLGVLLEVNMLKKFPDAFKKFKILSAFLGAKHDDGKQYEDKTMVNWLYLRFFVNPRRTLNVLNRGSHSLDSGIEKLKCNGGGKKRKKKESGLPLGTCFLEDNSGGDGIGIKFKLTTHMTTFLKEGKIPKETIPQPPQEKK